MDGDFVGYIRPLAYDIPAHQSVNGAALAPEAGELTASFHGRLVTYGFGELDALLPAYAASIHKSQGSEYPAVVIPVMTQRYAMLQRNLLYTGLTRASGL
jgi:exodeoxyribonuclease V alpha subunit